MILILLEFLARAEYQTNLNKQFSMNILWQIMTYV